MQALRNLNLATQSGHMARKNSREDLQAGRLSRRTTDPAAEAERKAAQEKMFSLDMDKVMKGVLLPAWLLCMRKPHVLPGKGSSSWIWTKACNSCGPPNYTC